MRPVLSTDPAYPGVNGKWQAMAYDFDMLRKQANGFTPILMPFLAEASGNLHQTLGQNFTKQMSTSFLCLSHLGGLAAVCATNDWQGQPNAQPNWKPGTTAR